MNPASSSRPLEVLAVTPSGTLGGAEQWLCAVLDATSRLTTEVVVLDTGRLTCELTRRDVPTSTMPTGARPADLLRTAWRLRRVLRSSDPDVVLANGVKSAVVAAPAAILTGRALVWVKHDRSYDGLLSRILGRVVDRVIAVSDVAAQAVGGAAVTVIPPPLSPSPPVSAEDAAAFWSAHGLRWDPHRRTLVMASRLVPAKGIADAITALTHAEADGWDLVVIGPQDPSWPGERGRLQTLATVRGVSSRVTFVEPVDDVSRWLAAFDAAAVLTRSTGPGAAGEGYGLVAAEAARAGVPVIATAAVPAARNLIGPQALVPEGDPAAVARALRAVARGEDVTPPLRAHAVAQLALADDVAARAVAVLASVAARPGAGLDGGPAVSVVSTVLNEAPEVQQLLDGVTAQLREDDEFVLVDGGSTDDTARVIADVISGDPRIRLLQVPGAGISAGRNAGTRVAVNQVVAFTDAGCRVEPGWLEALRRPFAEPEPATLVCGTYEPAGTGPLQRAVALACYPHRRETTRRTPLVRLYTRLFGVRFDATMPTGRSSAFDRAWLIAAGGFDEQLQTAEDVTLGRAVARQGGRCVLAVDAHVTWTQRVGLARQMRMWFRYGVGDGRSRDLLLVGRNLGRAVAYLLTGLITARGSRRRRQVALAAWGAYASLPLVRAVAERSGPAAALVPVALVSKDVSKILGCGVGLAQSGAGADRAAIDDEPPASSAVEPVVGGATRPPLHRGVAALLPSIGLDGRSRVLATVVSMLNEHGVIPDVVTYSQPDAATAMERLIDRPLRYRVRTIRPPLAARGALLKDLMLSQGALAQLPGYGGYVLLNAADVGFDPRAYVLRYVTFPAERIGEYELRYRREPHRTFGRVVGRRYRRLAGQRTPGGAWIANSAFIRELLVETYGVAPDSTDVVYGPVSIPAEPGLTSRNAEVVSVGGFHADKRQLAQLEMAAAMPDVAFRLIGSPRSPAYLRACRRRAAELDNVTIQVSPSTAEVRRVLSRAKVFLHTKHYEHQGLSTAEGIGFGCVPVVHDSGGQREVVPDEELRFGADGQAVPILRGALDGDFDDRLPQLRRHVTRFGEDAFRAGLRPYVEQLLDRVVQA